MAIVFIIIGVILGALTRHDSGILLGGIVGLLFWQNVQAKTSINKLKSLITNLEERFKRMAEQGIAPEASESKATPQVSRPAVTQKQSRPIELNTRQEPGFTSSDDKESESVPFVPEPKVAEAKKKASDSGDPWANDQYGSKVEKVASRWIRNFFTTGNVLAKLGVVILFVTIGSAAKYAADHSMLPVEFRMLGFTVLGLGLLIYGWRQRILRPALGLTLQGGGIGVIYITIFASYRLYNLLPGSFTFALLLAMCVLSSAIAVMQNSKALAVLSVSGAFLAPVLASTGSGSHVGLFTYYAVINVGILGIAWFKSWRMLNLVGFLFTFIIASMWGYKYYKPEFFASVEPFLVTFMVFYTIIPILFAIRQPFKLRGYVDSTLVFGVPTVGFALQYALVRDMDYGLAYSSMALFAYYVLIAYGLFKYVAKYKTDDGMRLLSEIFLSTGVVFGTIAIPLALDDQWSAAAWALEGCGMVYVAVRQNRLLAFIGGLVLQAGAAYFVVESMVSAGHASHMPILNGAMASGLLTCFAGLFSAYMIYRYKDKLKFKVNQLDSTVLTWAVVWWFGSIGYEVHHHASSQHYVFWLLIATTLTALLIHVICRKVTWPNLSFVQRLLAIPLVIGLIVSVTLKHPFELYTGYAWVATFATYYYLLRQYDTDSLSGAAKLQHGIAYWTLAVLLSWEGAWVMDLYFNSGTAWLMIPWLVIPTFMVFLVVSYKKLISWPIKKHFPPYMEFVLPPVIAVMSAVIVVSNLDHSGNATPLQYIPVLNPLDIAQLLALFSIVYWAVGIKKAQLNLPMKFNFLTINIGLCAMGFLWLNSALIRTIHHWYNIPLNMSTMMHNDMVQTSLTILWIVTAMTIMVIASRRASRATWMLGISLLGVVVVKIFAIDVSNLKSLEGIISFGGVAAVLLVLARVTPLPPKKDKVTENE